MLNLTQIAIDALVARLQEGYRRTYGGQRPDYAEIVGWAGAMALESIATSDALYHNAEHTILVTLVGQEILRGKHIREGGVSPEDWLHVGIALLCHDIGYVRGVCRDDRAGRYVTGSGGEAVELPPGATDAALTPYHVDRGKLFVQERFDGHGLIDVERVQRCIEPTRFPVPEPDDEKDTRGYPALVRAADLIGQLSDPRYLAKFYWTSVFPYVEDALGYLSATQAGQQVKASLYANVFVIEHEAPGGPSQS
jgi:hypothetical protein